MSIASEITRINNNIAAAYTALDGKGATMPAEGSQNSANLADTIDTITTGGGGGGTSTDFETIKGIMDDYSFSASSTSPDPSWTVRTGAIIYINSDEMLYGCVVEGVDKIWLSNEPSIYKIPSTAAYSEETVNGTSRACITFNGDEHWFCVATNNITNSNIYAHCMPVDGVVDTEFMPIAYIAYRANTTGKKGALLRDAAMINTYLKNVYIYDNGYFTFDEKFGYTIPSVSCVGFLTMLLKVGSPDWFWDNAPNMTKDSALPAGMATALMQTTGKALLASFEHFPFIVDLSTYEYFTGTLNLFGSTGAFANFPVLDIKIKLPSPASGASNPTITLNASTSYTGNRLINLTKAGLQYMAENAPTVTGTVKLELGSQNVATAGGMSSTIITTLTGKGWTIA